MPDVPPFRPLPDFFGDAVSGPPPADEVARDARGIALDPAVEADGAEATRPASANEAADRHALAADPASDIAADVAHPDGQMARVRRLYVPVALAVLGLVAFAILAATRSDLRAAPADGLMPADATAAITPPRPPGPDEPYTFSGLDIHPDRLYRGYFAGAFSGGAAQAGAGADFRWRLDMYRRAYGEDGNLAIRVYDERDGRVLDVQSVDAGMLPEGDWDAANLARRVLSETLRMKWMAQGIPREFLTIRWGYRDQTQEARDRDERYVPYEVNLARRLGLSVLATEIGTVETFNQDRLVSSAGARSRYQMMPDILRMFDVAQYTLPVASGGSVEVREEWHPLLSMEPSLMLVRAYSNAVGHELPGISAYHTGPGNLFALYREFLRAHPGLRNVRGRHVSDAYMWGVTEGFERVDAVSSFGPQSRVYVLKAYGALRATENRLVDPDQAFRGERVQIRPGQSIALSQLLAALEPHARQLDWGPVRVGSFYDRFRELNPHITLPISAGTDVPAIGDVRLSARAGEAPVRFFLPLGATAVLREAGLDVVGEMLPFDGTTFLLADGERTQADRDYDALVEDVGRFGFTRANALRLESLHDRMQTLALQNPGSRYRQTQAKVIRIHRSIWRTSGFRDLVATTEALFSADPLVRMGRETTAAAPAPAAPPPAAPAPAADPAEDAVQY